MLVFSEEELSSFVEDIVKCFSTDKGWGGLLFSTNQIKDVIENHVRKIVLNNDEECCQEGDEI